MAGNPNIKNMGVRFTKENAKEFGSRAGKKSVEARRNKKLLKDCLELLLEEKIKTKDGKKITGAEAICASQFKKALSGDTKAFATIRDTVGQKPVDKVMITEVSQDVIDEVEAMVNDDED